MVIPAQVQANFHRWVALGLDKTGEIHRKTLTPNDEGGSTEAWAPFATNVKFSVSEGFTGQQTIEQPILDKIGTRMPYILSFQHHLALREDDRIYQTSPSARTFEVISYPNKDVSNQGASRVIVIERG